MPQVGELVKIRTIGRNEQVGKVSEVTKTYVKLMPQEPRYKEGILVWVDHPTKKHVIYPLTAIDYIAFL